MSFNWDDIAGYPISALKDQCKSLNLPIGKQSTKREIIQILQDYRNQMNLNNKVNKTPLSKADVFSSNSSREASPRPSKMTPISTIKPSYLSSSRKHSSAKTHSNKNSSYKPTRTLSPVNRYYQEPKSDFCSMKNVCLILIILISLCLLFFVLIYM